MSGENQTKNQGLGFSLPNGYVNRLKNGLKIQKENALNQQPNGLLEKKNTKIIKLN